MQSQVSLEAVGGQVGTKIGDLEPEGKLRGHSC